MIDEFIAMTKQSRATADAAYISAFNSNVLAEEKDVFDKVPMYSAGGGNDSGGNGGNGGNVCSGGGNSGNGGNGARDAHGGRVGGNSASHTDKAG